MIIDSPIEVAQYPRVPPIEVF